MNKIMVKSNSFEDSFDRVIITDEADDLYVFDCDSHEAPTYYVALMPAFLDSNNELAFSPQAVIYSAKFYAVDELNKRGMLSSMLAVLEIEDNLRNPTKLQREFGGAINGLYQCPRQA